MGDRRDKPSLAAQILYHVGIAQNYDARGIVMRNGEESSRTLASMHDHWGILGLAFYHACRDALSEPANPNDQPFESVKHVLREPNLSGRAALKYVVKNVFVPSTLVLETISAAADEQDPLSYGEYRSSELMDLLSKSLEPKPLKDAA